MKAITISADSTADIPPEIIRQYGIRIIPSYVTMGDCSYDDWPNLNNNDLFRFYERFHIMPKTAANSPERYRAHFEKLLKEMKPVIHISKSSGISSCWNNAALSELNLDGVYVVDSKNLSGGSGLLTLIAAKSDLDDPRALSAMLEEASTRIDGSFIIETLEYLKKGGRCSSVSALGANILQLRPQIIVENGTMHVGKKYRGRYDKCVLSYIEDKLMDPEQYDPEMIFINHSLADSDLLKRVVECVKEKQYFNQIVEYPVTAGIACHCGPNTIGMFFLKKTGLGC